MQSSEKINLLVKNVNIKYCQKDLNYLSSFFFNHEILFKSRSQKSVSMLRAPFINKKSQLKFVKNSYSFSFSFYNDVNARFFVDYLLLIQLFLFSFIFLRLKIHGCSYTRISFFF